MKKTAFRLSLLLLTLALVFSLAACQTPTPQGPVDTGSSPVTDPLTDPATDPTTDPATDPEETPPETDPATDPATDPGETTPETDPETDPATDPEETTPEIDPDTEPQEIKNLILVIGDGMGLDHIAAGELTYGKDFGFADWDFVTVNTDSVYANGYGPVLTDSAASGTALATGHLTVNGYIGKDHNQVDVQTILDYAKSLGKATGVLTTDSLLGATPAAFSAHSRSRSNAQEIANSQIYSGVDLLGGATDSTCTALISQIEDQGYYYIDTFDNIDRAARKQKTYWQLDMAGTDADVQLEHAVYYALKMLSRNDEGFVLILEQAHIDKYSHSNDFANMAHSVNSLNNTVEVILEWMGERTDTAVLITADHETGGLSVSAQKGAYTKSYVNKSGEVIYYDWSSTNHTKSKVGLFTYGITTPDYSKFSYYGSPFTIKNIDVFNLMKDILDNPEAYNPYN